MIMTFRRGEFRDCRLRRRLGYYFLLFINRFEIFIVANIQPCS